MRASQMDSHVSTLQADGGVIAPGGPVAGVDAAPQQLPLLSP
jgi:hypothetical protein